MKNPTPREIVSLMLQKDQFSKWLNLSVVSIKSGRCTIELYLKQEMLNGFEILHGGIYFSLADSAIAFAANAKGKVAKTTQADIKYYKATALPNKLQVVATEIEATNKLGYYNAKITNNQNQLIAEINATVYFSSESLSSRFEAKQG